MLAKRSRLAIAIILVIGVSIALFASLSRNQITYFYTVADSFTKQRKFSRKKNPSSRTSGKRDCALVS